MSKLTPRCRNLAPCTLHAFLVLCLGACIERPHRLTVSLADGAGSTVLLAGLSRQSAAKLAAIPPTDGRWSQLLAIRAGAGLPAMAGSYEVADSSIRFTPRFAPEGISALHITLDREKWRSAGGSSVPIDQDLRWELTLPTRATPRPSTRLLAIHPSAPIVPANQLRWYLEFSAPMREGEALEHVVLRDARGRPVDKAFLDVDQELWDPTRTRLTLLFDMGRVKQGIRSRADLGAILQAGRRYTLEIDRGWHDARGATLLADTVHRFRTAPELHGAIDPAAWTIGTVLPGNRTPLVVTFGQPLDQALAERMIAVTSVDGERVAGTLTLLDGDRRLQFVPVEAWRAIPYQLRVHPALEDVAGNRVGHAFDATLAAGETAGVGEREVVVSIRD